MHLYIATGSSSQGFQNAHWKNLWTAGHTVRLTLFRSASSHLYCKQHTARTAHSINAADLLAASLPCEAVDWWHDLLQRWYSPVAIPYYPSVCTGYCRCGARAAKQHSGELQAMMFQHTVLAVKTLSQRWLHNGARLAMAQYGPLCLHCHIDITTAAVYCMTRSLPTVYTVYVLATAALLCSTVLFAKPHGVAEEPQMPFDVAHLGSVCLPCVFGDVWCDEHHVHNTRHINAVVHVRCVGDGVLLCWHGQRGELRLSSLWDRVAQVVGSHNSPIWLELQLMVPAGPPGYAACMAKSVQLPSHHSMHGHMAST